jgi:hypothetical protein
MANVRRLVRLASLTLPTLLATCAALTRAAEIGDAELIRQLERQRLPSLVAVDLDTARRLHRDDFQLITPSGAVVTKEEYLAILESGQLNYVAWEAGDITVKVFGDAAIIRYRDLSFDVNNGDQAVHRGPMVHTNLWERRDGAWQIVWSQASGIIRP